MARKKKNPTWTDVKKIISNSEKDQLIDLIGDLYRLSDGNKDFFHIRFSLIDNPLKDYKRVIEESLYPDIIGNEDVDFARAEKVINQYSKAVDDLNGECELLVFAVECGNNFTLDIGDIDEVFYDSLLDIYERAIEAVQELPEKKKEAFKQRLKDIMDSGSFIGWGYGDGLCELYYEGFPEDQEELQSSK